MLNIIEFLYKKGVDFSYSYIDRINHIEINRKQMLEFTEKDLIKICNDNEVSFGVIEDTFTIDYSPYEGY